MSPLKLKKPFVVLKQAKQMRLVVYVDAWSWHCDWCGWHGVDLTSEKAAENEATRHCMSGCPNQGGDL